MMGKDDSSAVARSSALIVTAVDDIDSAAAHLAARLDLTVEIASSRAAALRLLDRRIYSIVVLDQLLAEADPDGADLIWKHSGHAIPLQISFALAGTGRLEREFRAALARRHREQSQATAAALASVDGEIRNAVTGFLLESRLALAERDLAPSVRARIENLCNIAGRLQQLLASAPSAAADAPAGSLRPQPN